MAKSAVGIDISAEQLKMVCLLPKGAGYKLVAHALVDRNDESALQEMLRHRAIRQGFARFSIRDPNIKIRKVSTPIVPKQELEEVIKWSLKEVVKVSLEDHIFRYYPLSGEPDAKKQSFLVFAMERGKLQEQLIELQKLGFGHPQVIEPHVQAMTNCIVYNYELENTDRYAVLVFDKTLSYFAVISAEGILFHRTFSGVHTGILIAELSAELGIDPLQAEKCLDSGCEDIATEQQAKLTRILSHFFSKMAVEIQYSRDSYLAQFPGQMINHVLLAGEGVGLKGLQSHVEETLQVPTSKLEAFKKIDVSTFPSEEIDNAAMYYGVAIGLAL
jgi:Tfp pilus assembly PilM family ATPase